MTIIPSSPILTTPALSENTPPSPAKTKGVAVLNVAVTNPIMIKLSID
jgi:hypothetical protein